MVFFTTEDPNLFISNSSRLYEASASDATGLGRIRIANEISQLRIELRGRFLLSIKNEILYFASRFGYILLKGKGIHEGP